MNLIYSIIIEETFAHGWSPPTHFRISKMLPSPFAEMETSRGKRAISCWWHSKIWKLICSENATLIARLGANEARALAEHRLGRELRDLFPWATLLCCRRVPWDLQGYEPICSIYAQAVGSIYFTRLWAVKNEHKVLQDYCPGSAELRALASLAH